MNKDELLKTLEKLKKTANSHTHQPLFNGGYREGIMDAIDLVKNLSLGNVMDKFPDTDFHCVECGHGIHNGICPNCNK